MYSEVRKAYEKKGRRLPVSRVLEILGVSKSGYYDWVDRKPSKRELHKLDMQKKIMKIHEDSKQIYGAPKITRKLKSQGEQISERTVTRYMHEMGIRAWYRRPYTVTTHSLDFSEKLKNILKRDFSPDKPDSVWCTDITYIHTGEGFLYLSCIMDLYSRKIIAWELGRTLETVYVVNAINKAIARTGKKPLIIHQDRGVQYTSEEYADATKGIDRSYSAKGTPWDNACIESFHSLIKREWLWRYKVKDYDHAYRLIFDYIDAFYNTVRIHSHCDYLSPKTYEELYYLKLKELEKGAA